MKCFTTKYCFHHASRGFAFPLEAVRSSWGRIETKATQGSARKPFVAHQLGKSPCLLASSPPPCKGACTPLASSLLVGDFSYGISRMGSELEAISSTKGENESIIAAKSSRGEEGKSPFSPLGSTMPLLGCVSPSF
jgi:hypothetical protein